MLGECLQFSYIAKIGTFILFEVPTICIDCIRCDFAKSNTSSTYTFKCKPKATNTGKKIYK